MKCSNCSDSIHRFTSLATLLTCAPRRLNGDSHRRTHRFWFISSCESGLSPRRLAKHLGVAPSTLSASITCLSRLDYISSRPCEKSRCQHELRLTARGAEATLREWVRLGRITI